jgi:hypothetical protein
MYLRCTCDEEVVLFTYYEFPVRFAVSVPIAYRCKRTGRITL